MYIPIINILEYYEPEVLYWYQDDKINYIIYTYLQKIKINKHKCQ